MLTVKQVAKQLGVSYSFALRLIRAGELKAINISPGRRHPCYRVEPASVDGFKQANEVQPAS
ncbi:helix-turn-helix domain-containing protein [Blastopirellula marina]|uniref:helix-turn-helix domain-containing protein n=1 Tax=Blastopirellula marina TaxID=124 RepID=UPI0013048C41|nr:helix-turn-helix domain-containing protein [Blastopirellula marina]